MSAADPNNLRAALRQRQLAELNALLTRILPENRFYAEKFAGQSLPLRDWEDFLRLPTTSKSELAASPPADRLTVHQTWPTARYARYHQTSGTSGRPLIVLETRDDWTWWMQVWQRIFDAADVRPGDRVLMAFSFGPFIGFWSAYDAALTRGCLLIPGGGMSSYARLELARNVRADVVLCTPSYALHLAAVGRERGLPVESLGVRQLVLAGEPGGSIPAVRARIEQAWHTHVHDHAGATEVGPWGYGDRDGRGLFVTESDFIAEFLTPDGDTPAAPGEQAELVLTCLGRTGCPCIRYRTHDLVRPRYDVPNPAGFVFLDGGVLGRVDDMLVVRGVNIFPSSIEAILREFSAVDEYRVTVTTVADMDQLSIELEAPAELLPQLGETLRARLGLKVELLLAATGTLPRSEGKARRWIDRRVSKV